VGKIAADAVSAISAVAGDFAYFTPLVFIPPHRG
jgi:hypothetical protein